MTEKSTIEELIKELQAGRMILIMDNEDRENEGDVVCGAKEVTLEQVNFMASEAKGLICMPMSEEMGKRLGLSPMCPVNTDNHETAFTQSIDYIDTTTGISAEERAVTARKAAIGQASDFRRPGHMFPLIAKKQGVLERAGHTEATVDLLELAGQDKVGLCCEIMKEDGTMARKEDLQAFAGRHGLKWGTVEDLILYRKQREEHIEEVAMAKLPTEFGTFLIRGYRDQITGEEITALTMGEWDGDRPVLCRIHSQCLTGDVFGSGKCDCGQQLHEAMRRIGERGEGVLIYLPQEGRGIGLLNKLKAYELQEQGLDTVDANVRLGFSPDGRDYYQGAQVLRLLGIKQVELMTNNPEKVSGLEKYGMTVARRLAIQIAPGAGNRKYLWTKQERMGHVLQMRVEEAAKRGAEA